MKLSKYCKAAPAFLCALTIAFGVNQAQAQSLPTSADESASQPAAVASSAWVANYSLADYKVGDASASSTFGSASDLSAASSPAGASAATADLSAGQSKPWDWKDHVWLNLNGKSYHFNRDKGYNERNWGAGVQIFTSENTSWLIGHYQNSFYRPTNYVWYNYQPWRVGNVQLGVMGGLVTGYRARNPNIISGTAALSATIHNDHYLLNFACVPTVACVASVGFKFW